MMKTNAEVSVRFRGDGPAESATEYTGPGRRNTTIEIGAVNRVEGEIYARVALALQKYLQGGGATHFVYKKAPEGAPDDDMFRERIIADAIDQAIAHISLGVTKIHDDTTA